MAKDSEQAHYEQEAAEAAKEIKAQDKRRICNECSHVWTAQPIGSTNDPDWLALALAKQATCPECGSEDSISEADILADQAEGGLPA